MEHVPQATGSPHPPIKVPYFVSKRFESVIYHHKNTSAEWEYTDTYEPLPDSRS